MLAAGGDLEAALTPGADAVQLNELLHPQLAHADASCKQLLPDARPAVPAARFGMDGLDVHQQRVIAQMAPLGIAGAACEVPVVSRHADLEHSALHRNPSDAPVALDEGVL